MLILLGWIPSSSTILQYTWLYGQVFLFLETFADLSRKIGKFNIMLKSFSVSNFLSFSEKITFDLSAGDYDFNTSCIKNGIVNNAAIFGKNGSGKTDLFIAMQNICLRIDSKFALSERYYIAYNSRFCYEFLINGIQVIYEYAFDSEGDLSEESLVIGNDSNRVWRNFAYDKCFLSYLYQSSYMIENEQIRAIINALYDFVCGMLFYCTQSMPSFLPECGENWLNYISSGEKTRTFLKAIMTRMEDNSIPFLFIDNFDTFLDIHNIQYLIKELKELDMQFILICNNTVAISNDILGPDCYFTLGKNGIKSFQKSTEKELRYSHDIEKMYRAGNFLP